MSFCWKFLFAPFQDDAPHEEMFVCYACAFKHNDFVIFKKHVRRHQLGRSRSKLKCIACEKRFTNHRSWERHLQNVHDIPEGTVGSVAQHPNPGLFPIEEESAPTEFEETPSQTSENSSRLEVAELLGFLRDNHCCSVNECGADCL